LKFSWMPRARWLAVAGGASVVATAAMASNALAWHVLEAKPTCLGNGQLGLIVLAADENELAPKSGQLEVLKNGVPLQVQPTWTGATKVGAAIATFPVSGEGNYQVELLGHDDTRSVSVQVNATTANCPTPTPTPSSTPSPTPTPTPSPSATPSMTPTPEVSASPTPTPTPVPASTATPSPTPTPGMPGTGAEF
jgi:hypothetical protein